jgi:hypothetical protein
MAQSAAPDEVVWHRVKALALGLDRSEADCRERRRHLCRRARVGGVRFAVSGNVPPLTR